MAFQKIYKGCYSIPNTYFIDIESCFSARFDEMNIQFFCFFFSFLQSDLSKKNRYGVNTKNSMEKILITHPCVKPLIVHTSYLVFFLSRYELTKKQKIKNCEIILYINIKNHLFCSTRLTNT